MLGLRLPLGSSLRVGGRKAIESDGAGVVMAANIEAKLKPIGTQKNQPVSGFALLYLHQLAF